MRIKSVCAHCQDRCVQGFLELWHDLLNLIQVSSEVQTGSDQCRTLVQIKGQRSGEGKP